ncbi:MAG: cell division protein FtsA [Alphaproteobacteria bacterium]|nr:cell division protein FtsA [Alphaproteobacteria bacterium]
MSFDGGTGSVTRKLVKPRTGTVAVLDIGTSKVCCLIARAGRAHHDDMNAPAAQPRIIGAGHQVSRGVRNGMIVDVDAAEDAIRKAVHMAEQIAQETISSVTVNLSAGAPRSEILGVDVDIGGQQIDDGDLRRIFQHTQALRQENGGPANGGPNGTDRELIHSIPVGFAIDGQQGIADPRGMFGERLSVNMHLVSASTNAVRTIRAAVQRCHLDIDGFVLSPYAAGLATLVEDESDLGVTVVDMGGGTTGLAIFYDGEMIFADTLPVGGNHVTSDVARGLSTSLAHAERLKTLHGNAIAAESDEHELIDVPQVGDDEHTPPQQLPRSLLNGIIQPRMEETFELVRARLDDSGFAPFAGRRVVLAGGASQLQGARELAARILDKQVRMGRPLRVRGLAEAIAGPAFATGAGLIAHAIENPSSLTMASPVPTGEPGRLTGRLGQWFREHF